MHKVKGPAVAGLFYPEDSNQLSEFIDQLFKGNHESDAPIPAKAPTGLITPHAGYLSCAEVATRAYAQLLPFAESINRVAILAPAHTLPLSGVALCRSDFFSTPLGKITVNHELDELFIRELGAVSDDRPFEKEHGIEVQLPFLQKTLKDFSIVPIVVGETDAIVVERMINHLVNNKHLVIISTDLTHFLPYSEAKIEDDKTRVLIEKKFWSKIQPDHACGHYPLRGMIKWCQSQRKKIETLEVTNSGDTTGDKKKVVGFGSWVIT